MRTEFNVGLKRVSSRRISLDRQKFKKEPIVRQYLILAHHIRITLESNPKMTLKKIANCIGLTPARVSQIMSLLYLSPSIQEEILLSDNSVLLNIAINTIQKISHDTLWNQQKLNTI